MHTKPLIVVSLAFALVACQSTSPTEQDQSQRVANRPVTTPKTQTKPNPYQDILKAVSRLRDRPWKRPVTLEAVDVQVLPVPKDKRSPQKLERQRVAQMLVNQPAGLEPVPWTLHRVAQVDPKANIIRYAKQHADVEALKRAIFFAGVEALDQQYDTTRKSPRSFDEQRAQNMAHLASPMFALALYDLQKKYPKITATELANRPELVRQHGWLGEHLKAMETNRQWSSQLQTHRMNFALGLATAMYRAQGWSGVELIRAQLPQGTLQVSNPSSWMGAQALGQWSMPDAWQKQMGQQGWFVEHRGQLGPMLFSFWLGRDEQFYREAMMLPLTLQADQYMIYRKQDHRALIWLMQWDTPSWASSVKKTIESIIAKQKLAKKANAKDKTPQIEVLQDGVMTAIIIHTDGASVPDVKPSLKARVTYSKTENFPVTYVPAHLDRWAAGMTRSTFDAKRAQWVDPMVKLQAKLDAVPKSWKIQLNRRGSLRWYARGKAEMIQLVLELSKPLESPFDSKAYAKQLQTNLTKSLSEAKVSHFKRIKHNLGPAYEVTIDGKLGGKATRLSIWHIAHDGYLLTLSATAPPKRHAAVSQVAAKILPTLSSTSQSTPKAKGIQQFKVEP